MTQEETDYLDAMETLRNVATEIRDEAHGMHLDALSVPAHHPDRARLTRAAEQLERWAREIEGVLP